MSIIKIDGKSYDVGVNELSRNAQIVYDSLTAGEMLDYSETHDAVGTAYEYSLKILAKSGKSDDYNAFYLDITSPKSIRIVELPFGNETIIFNARIETASDGLKVQGGLSMWTELDISFKPCKPQRYN